MNLFKYFICIVGFSIILTGCSDDNSVNSNNGSDPPELEINGSATGYAGDGHELYPRDRFDPLGEGTLNADGSFQVTLWSGSDIDDELEELETGFGGFEPFPCMTDESFQVSEPDARFGQVRAIMYDDDETELAKSIVLNDQTEGEVDRLNPLLGHGEKRVYWIYADREVSVQGECEITGVGQMEQRMVDLNLEVGWNEIIFDFRDRNDLRMIQGSRPASVDWYTDWGEE